MTEPEIKAKRGRPKNSKNRPKDVVRLSTRRMCELIDGSSPADLSERQFLRRWAKLTPAQQMQRRLDMQPRERPESVTGTQVRLFVAGIPGTCPSCGHIFPAADRTEAFREIVSSSVKTGPAVDTPSEAPHAVKSRLPGRRAGMGPVEFTEKPEDTRTPREIELEEQRIWQSKDIARQEKLLLALNESRDQQGLERLGTLPENYQDGDGGFSPCDGF